MVLGKLRSQQTSGAGGTRYSPVKVLRAGGAGYFSLTRAVLGICLSHTGGAGYFSLTILAVLAVLS